MLGGGNAPSGQMRLLVCHETQLAIYDASQIESIYRWMPQGQFSGAISSATYSCNGQVIFATTFLQWHKGNRYNT